MDEHFVPENPDMMRDALTIDLAGRVAVDSQHSGEMTEEGLRFSGAQTQKIRFLLPFHVKKDSHVMVEITGRFDSEKDKGLTVTLTNGSLASCSTSRPEIRRVDGQVFTETLEYTANQAADSIMLSGSSVLSRFNDVTILKIRVVSDVMNDPGSLSYSESVKQEWYQALLDNAVLNLGSTVRLREVIARAQAGEKITIATIGGSITEGAGAMTYKECYAYKIFEGFKARYGAGDGSNVAFVNAGVGGTPSPFGWMRWERDIVSRVKDDDGLPDLVIIEYAVNDGGEPTNHRAYESMVRSILAQPNHPAVILLFSVFPSGYVLQKEISPVGYAADLMMISIKNGAFPYVNDKWSEEAFFYDMYHPTSLGHSVMADCVLHGIEQAAEDESNRDVDLTAAPAFGTDFIGMQRIFRDSIDPALGLELGSFSGDDTASYQNLPVGRVCGKNFHHAGGSNEPLTFTASFKNLMIAYRAVGDTRFGDADVYIDGKWVKRLKGNTGSWGQSVVDLLWDKEETADHTVEIRMAEGSEASKFTITCISYTP